ncbi:GTP-binding protein TypA/BipA [Rhizobium sp. PP-F2F-G38]|uniref:Large ribosomal subunit assembly factor BipA n=1 Tax=Ferranicluibacter rubi TaxID=2715133 RepID=A0AA44CC78_9HYPH|nr:translational GTPase TypA [Ferranicluibacter rubi]PYE25254.1 GTP-binding protein TypA/BipA [Rhizobium sp. PP-CC-3A-592]PYE32994.1 GTP-binding protein TypA/BipA [Rhizobium sp. PP-WC-1G-195]PYE42182.1 GTP-binding protein TypA/BipA [Rhizobium sp. PP-F2F-G20b]PYE97043.1 GTP-binding protein TypA/BipA [Rhizobium sp. PP-F2F-G38]TCL92987.1 GTP-binding protein TypA/BipA [Rhizobium sp. PP-WC-2G-219]TCP87788.1 GTP-binding protein TypA/BipA [Rhizobium sp. PP-CC-2G-626]TCQ06826.1 GTP-binding protein T
MKMRNIAIIAHVDHGKTTLVDEILKQSGSFRDNQRTVERMMDSNDLEKERGITILAKATSIEWKGVRINIVDTPGHADFGGEVERILSMVDGAIVLVDSSEGPMPQTKFVVSKALKVGLRPIVAINKIDRPDGRHEEVINEVFDLFANLDATDEQLDFPILYGSGRDGWMNVNPEGPKDQGLAPLLDLVLEHVPEPSVGDEDGAFRMIGTLLEANPFLGRVITGRIHSGSIKPNQSVKVMSQDGKVVETGRISKILAFRGIERTAIDEAHAGDIVAIAGLSKGTVADTFCDPSVTEALEAQPIDPPTVTMSFLVNDSPLAGTEGDKVTSRVIRDRLFKEAEGNVALKIEESEGKDSFFVSGRGELQLAVLIETMRREGFELAVSRPRVVMHKDEDGNVLEPIEEVVIDVDEEHSGVVVQKMSERKAELAELRPSGGSRVRLKFFAPTRGLIGYQSELLTDTRGTAIMNRLFHDYQPFKGEIGGRTNGVLLSNQSGEAVAYAMFNLEDRGPMIIEPGEKVYAGMIIGIHSRDNDLEVNVLKGKQLTNIRSAGKDEAVRLTPPIRMTLDRALSWIQDDELMEVTPKNIRLRKTYLDANDRKRFGKGGKGAAA